jgi:predicted ester cyclase
MRRYCIDYSYSHDLDIIDEVMADDYVVHTCGLHLARDPDYRAAVARIFSLFPGLGFTVHEILTNGDRLAMRFSEHGMSGEGRRMSCWRGIALYRWNGTQLTDCYVEQDFASRRRQVKAGEPDAMEPPHLDPWTATEAVPADPGAEKTVSEWLERGDLAAAPAGWIDAAPISSHVRVLTAVDVDVNDLFSVGDRVAFHVNLRGEYNGELADGTDGAKGSAATIAAAGIATVDGDHVVDVRIVTDRLGLRARLLGLPLV